MIIYDTEKKDFTYINIFEAYFSVLLIFIHKTRRQLDQINGSPIQNTFIENREGDRESNVFQLIF